MPPASAMATAGADPACARVPALFGVHSRDGDGVGRMVSHHHNTIFCHGRRRVRATTAKLPTASLRARDRHADTPRLRSRDVRVRSRRDRHRLSTYPYRCLNSANRRAIVVRCDRTPSSRRFCVSFAKSKRHPPHAHFPSVVSSLLPVRRPGSRGGPCREACRARILALDPPPHTYR